MISDVAPFVVVMGQPILNIMFRDAQQGHFTHQGLLLNCIKCIKVIKR